MTTSPSLGTARNAPKREPAHDGEPSGTARILVVDDNAATRRFVRHALEIEGFHVTEADGGAAAIEICARALPDLVLIDLCMRDMRGTDVLARLRSDDQAVGLPVIVFTGAPDEVDENGPCTFNDLIAKPASAEILVEAVRHHLAERPVEPLGRPDGSDRSRLERDRAELDVLRGLAEALSHSDDLDTALAEALSRCLHAIGASRGSVFLEEIDGGFSVRSHLGDLDRVPGVGVPAREQLFRRVLDTGETLVVDTRSGALGYATSPPPGRHPSTVVAPVASGDDRFGVLVVEVPSHEDLRFWIEFLKLVGLGLGLAVGDARRSGRRRDSAPTSFDTTRHGVDELTGLADTDTLEEALALAIADPASHGALVVLDLDRIRHVNDALGHHTGDELLRGFGHCLGRLVTPEMTLARLHSDVFAIVAPGLSSVEDATALARRILVELEAPIRCNGYTLYATTSIGIALFPEHGRQSGALFQYANTALDQAKERGGNTVEVYSDRSREVLWERLTIDQGLRAALERDEFALHYQPVVDLKTRRATATEALLRWDRPVHGMTSAAVFIEVAEQTGLIVPIGRWVLRRAAEQARAWQDAGTPRRVAFNVGAREFHEGALDDDVARVLDETGADPTNLGVEVTETVALADLGHTVTILDRLRELGVNVALDDFGTGYSSLRYVQELPIDTLKIDRSFVDKAVTDDRGVPMLAGIVDLAHRLGTRVVAEGIESDAHLELVCSLGCDEAQGYHLGRPAPPEELREVG